jgi:hypothetical protein
VVGPGNPEPRPAAGHRRRGGAYPAAALQLAATDPPADARTGALWETLANRLSLPSRRGVRFTTAASSPRPTCATPATGCATRKPLSQPGALASSGRRSSDPETVRFVLRSPLPRFPEPHARHRPGALADAKDLPTPRRQRPFRWASGVPASGWSPPSTTGRRMFDRVVPHRRQRDDAPAGGRRVRIDLSGQHSYAVPFLREA